MKRIVIPGGGTGGTIAANRLRRVYGTGEAEITVVDQDDSKKRHEHIKVASVGNPGLHMATIVGALPGMPGLLTAYMERKMGKLDIPPIPEFIEMIADTGAGLYGCQASCDLFGLGKDDLIDQVTGIITVGEFYALSAGGQIIFT